MGKQGGAVCVAPGGTRMGETVVLLPGIMSDARIFGPQLADLSRDQAVMTVPLSSGERIEEIASGLLDLMPQRIALLGFGFGGVVAMEVLRRAPDRVSRLCLMSATPLPETPQQAAAREPQMIRARSGKLEQVLEEELRLGDLAPGPFRGEIIAMVKDMGLGLGVECFVRQSRALQRRRDQQSTLRRIHVPTMVICGALDVVLPVKRHAFLAELVPNAVLRVIEGAAHLPTLEQPEAVAKALRDWLSMPLVLR